MSYRKQTCLIAFSNTLEILCLQKLQRTIFSLNSKDIRGVLEMLRCACFVGIIGYCCTGTGG